MRMQQFAVPLVSWRHKLAKLLRKCSKKTLFNQGKQIHGAIVTKGFDFDLMIGNDLICMYWKCGRVDAARGVFDRMHNRNVVTWTALMYGFLQYGDAGAALLLLREMGFSDERPNEFTFSMSFKASGVLGIPEYGMQIQSLSSKRGFACYPEVASSATDMYLRCKKLTEAERMFQAMPNRTLISWNVMIAGYAREGMGEKALFLFKDLQRKGEVPDDYTFTSTLKACTSSEAITEGIQVHACLINRGFSVQLQAIIAGALIDLYVKCGCLMDAHKVFNEVEDKSVMSWTTIIVGYAQDGNLSQAMNLFGQLRATATQADEFLFSSIMGVFADFALIELGKQVHCYVIKVSANSDVAVANSIIDMYLKCGLTEEAERLFTHMPKKNVISWTVMITGFAKHGLGKEAVHLFNSMAPHNVKPDEVTYLAILSACSHAGLVEEGREFFMQLLNEGQIKATVEHYACMIDILGRAGRLNEAQNLIVNMPLKPNAGIWQTLLSACRVHKNVEIAQEVGEILLSLDGDNPVNYVMLSNIYADARCWKECERLRKLVAEKGLTKEAGRSWVEIDKDIHFFYNGDEAHPLIKSIHEFLREMENRLKEERGYKFEASFSLHDVEEESKEESMRFHSEKLAIGLAVVCGAQKKEGMPIRVFKNLRVCGDCHEFIKGLSKVLNKVFLVRDANRFHKFEKGVCSCGDYW